MRFVIQHVSQSGREFGTVEVGDAVNVASECVRNGWARVKAGGATESGA